jgi:hypothetical protein
VDLNGAPLPAPPPPPPPPLDAIPPDTSITSSMEGTGTALATGEATLSRSLTLTFVGTDNIAVARFECQLDGAGFSACTSPATYTGLLLGRHSFEVRAVDSSGIPDATPASYAWNVDVPPETTITRASDARGKTVADGARHHRTRSPSASQQPTTSPSGGSNASATAAVSIRAQARSRTATSPGVPTASRSARSTITVSGIRARPGYVVAMITARVRLSWSSVRARVGTSTAAVLGSQSRRDAGCRDAKA